MLNVIANPLFQRTVRIVNDEYAKYININYKPKNYWVDDAITVRIEFKRLSSRGVNPSGFEYEGTPVSFDVRYSGGGQESGVNIDPIETIENFRAALGDAVSIVNHVKEQIKAGASFLKIATQVAALDLPAVEMDVIEPIVIVHIGDNLVVSKGMLFGNIGVAKSRLRALYSDQAIQFEERDAKGNEAEYWWFKLKSNQVKAIRD